MSTQHPVPVPPSNVDAPSPPLSYINGDQVLKLKSPLNTQSMYERWPPGHCLASKAPNTITSCQQILETLILSQRVGLSLRNVVAFHPDTMEILHKHLLPEIGSLVDRHRKYNFKQGFHQAINKCKGQYPTTDTIPQEAVRIFVCDVINEVVPCYFVGQCWRGLKKLALQIIQGSPPLTIKHLMRYKSHNLNAGWMDRVKSNLVREYLAAKILLWLAADYIPTLLRSVVIITRSASGKLGNIFYSKPQWQSMARKALNDLVETGYLTKIPRTEIINPLYEPGRLTFVPKSSGKGLRPIVKRSIKNEQLKQQFNDSRLLMKAINGPQLKINEAWCSFRNMVLGVRADGKKGHVYFVRTDVRSAFVTLRQEKVMEVLQNNLDALPPKVELELPPIKRKKTENPTGGPLQQLDNKKEPPRRVVRKKVLAVKEPSKLIRREILSQVVEHGHHIAIGNKPRPLKYYNMKVGLAQGSPLSNQLCEMVLIDLCQKCLSQFNSEDGRTVLWRVADDFLLLTLDKEKAEDFKEAISAGFPDYDWRMNMDKSLDNLEHNDVHHVSFSGFTFDLRNLEASADLSQNTASNVLFSMSLSQSNPQQPNIVDIPNVFLNALKQTGSLKLVHLSFNASALRRSTIFQHVATVAKLQALRLRALLLYLYPEEAKARIPTPKKKRELANADELRAIQRFANFVMSCIKKASDVICKRILFLALETTKPDQHESLPSDSQILWVLYSAIMRRSSGYLGQARFELQKEITALEKKLSAQAIQECGVALDAFSISEPRYY